MTLNLWVYCSQVPTFNADFRTDSTSYPTAESEHSTGTVDVDLSNSLTREEVTGSDPTNPSLTTVGFTTHTEESTYVDNDEQTADHDQSSIETSNDSVTTDTLTTTDISHESTSDDIENVSEGFRQHSSTGPASNHRGPTTSDMAIFTDAIGDRNVSFTTDSYYDTEVEESTAAEFRPISVFDSSEIDQENAVNDFTSTHDLKDSVNNAVITSSELDWTTQLEVTTDENIGTVQQISGTVPVTKEDVSVLSTGEDQMIDSTPNEDILTSTTTNNIFGDATSALSIYAALSTVTPPINNRGE